MKVKIRISDNMIGISGSVVAAGLFFILAETAKTISNLKFGYFLFGASFLFFIIMLCCNDKASVIVIEKEVEIKIKNPFDKFKIGDIVDTINGAKHHTRGEIIKIYNKKYYNPYRVMWKDGTLYTYQKEELKLSRIEDWRQRIK